MEDSTQLPQSLPRLCARIDNTAIENISKTIVHGEAGKVFPKATYGFLTQLLQCFIQEHFVCTSCFEKSLLQMLHICMSMQRLTMSINWSGSADLYFTLNTSHSYTSGLDQTRTQHVCFQSVMFYQISKKIVSPSSLISVNSRSI